MSQIAVIPVGAFTPDEQRKIEIAAYNAAAARYKQIYPGAGEPVVRDVVVGDPAGVPDFKDLDVKTRIEANQIRWGQVNTLLTAYTLSQIMLTSTKVATGKVIFCYGVIDLSTTKDLVLLRYKRGAKDLLVAQMEKCYGHLDAPDGAYFIDTSDPSGLKPALLEWPQNQVVSIEQAHVAAATRFVVHKMLIAEPVSETMDGVAAK